MFGLSDEYYKEVKQLFRKTSGSQYSLLCNLRTQNEIIANILEPHVASAQDSNTVKSIIIDALADLIISANLIAESYSIKEKDVLEKIFYNAINKGE